MTRHSRRDAYLEQLDEVVTQQRLVLEAAGFTQEQVDRGMEPLLSYRELVREDDQ